MSTIQFIETIEIDFLIQYLWIISEGILILQVFLVQYFEAIILEVIKFVQVTQFTSHIAQNIAETCQKYFQSFITIEIWPQHYCQLFQNISLQR